MLHLQGREQLVDHQEAKQGGPCCPGGRHDKYDNADVDDDDVDNGEDERYVDINDIIFLFIGAD